MEKALRSGCGKIIILFILLIPPSAKAESTLDDGFKQGQKFAEQGKTYIKQKNYLGALTMFRQAYLLYPVTPMLPFSVGRAYMELKECEKAHEYFSLTLVHHLSDEMPEEAKNIVLNFIASNPHCATQGNVRNIHTSRQLLAEGMELYLQSDMTGSAQKFKDSMKFAPSLEASLRLALIYSLGGDCDGLKAYFDKAEKLGDLSEFAGFLGLLKQNSEKCFDPCEKITCSEHGTCVAQAESATCKCEQGYYADELQCLPENADPCSEIACSWHGKCVVQNNAVTCECEQGYIANGTDCSAIPITTGKEDGVSPMAWVLGGTAVVSIAVSIVFGARANSLQSDLEKETALGRFDSKKAENIWSDIETSDTMFNVFLWSGIGLGATSLLLFIFTGGDSEDKGVSLGPVLEPGLVGAGMSGRF